MKRVNRLKSAIAASLVLLGLAASPAGAAQDGPTAPFPVEVTVDPDVSLGTLPPIWRFFGADEPNYATHPDGEKLLLALGQLRPGSVYFRAHNMMSTGDGTGDFKWGSTNLYTEVDGKPVYDFTIVDEIIDTYLARGIHPYLELGFMPEAISSAPETTPYYSPWKQDAPFGGTNVGWAQPPSDYDKWGEIIYRWTLHNVARYGRDEVEKWYFQTWNEPNLEFYWTGNLEDFLRLHDVAIDAVRRALPTARVGGPDVAGSGGKFMEGFLRHVTTGTNYATGETGTPTDFISFHAKGQPEVVDGHVRMGISNQLKTVDEAFRMIAAVPELADKPVIIGENDPEGCAACSGPANAYRNGKMYASYTAAAYPRLWELARARNIDLEGALSWAYVFPDQPWFAGYRQLATNNVDLAVLNVFRLFARLGEEQVGATSSGQAPLRSIVTEGVRGAPDVGALATRREDGTLAILLWHYHDDDVSGPAAQVHVALPGVGAGDRVTLWRVDETHANAYHAWREMGAPQEPSEAQVRALQEASRLVPEPTHADAQGIDLAVPRQGVVLVEVHPNP